MAETGDVRSTIQKRDAEGVIRHGGEWLALWADPESVKSNEQRQHDKRRNEARAVCARSIAAASRALSSEPDMPVSFGQTSAQGHLGIGLPKLPDDLDDQAIFALRGQADGLSLRRRYSDGQLHAELSTGNDIRQRLFDVCEDVRCQALGAYRLAGVEVNLIACQLDRLRRADLMNAHLASLVPPAEAIQMVLRDHFLRRSDPSIPTSAFWMWDRWLRERLTLEFSAMREAINHQRLYAAASLIMIDALLNMLGGGITQRPKNRLSTGEPGQTGEFDPDSDSHETPASAVTTGQVYEPGADLFLNDDAEAGPETPPLPASDKSPKPYGPFTTGHDRIVRAQDIASPEQLLSAQRTLDEKRAEFRRDLVILANRLRRRLLARQRHDWEFDLEEGLIDASRLDRVVVNPGFAQAYKQERDTEIRDTVVSILIDNSGSMRGKPIEIACVTADIVAAALERCGIACEVLGFTTGGWKGGQSAKDWIAAGRPADPGRLNDLLHILYKTADEPYRRARQHLAAMLDANLLKENIDGEALLWAARRLLARPEQRRILVVISDGSPVDEITVEENSDTGLLDRHLRSVIAEIEASKALELAAIGVRHDVGNYYAQAATITKVDDLGKTLVGLLDQLLVSKS